MLKEYVEAGFYSFHDSFDSWEDALRASVQPLIEQGVVGAEYAAKVVDSVKRYGPYIVIHPNICIPHAQVDSCVFGTAIAVMRTKEPVVFSEDAAQDVRLFFALASKDEEIHLNNLKELAEVLDDENRLKRLLDSESKEDLLAALS